MTPHIEAKKEEIAKKVLMPGDPKRATFIAENYLEQVKVVNNVRGMTAYTGYYKGEKITVFPSGMGMPSMGIYAYELFKFYDVDVIIRIGTCGAYTDDYKLLDVIMAKEAYTPGLFTIPFCGKEEHILKADEQLNKALIKTAQKQNIAVKPSLVITNDAFDPYIDVEAYLKSLSYPAEVAEMEAFALFFMAKLNHKKSACLATVVDCLKSRQAINAYDREQALGQMIVLALETLLTV